MTKLSDHKILDIEADLRRIQEVLDGYRDICDHYEARILELQKELSISMKFHSIAVKERDLERLRMDALRDALRDALSEDTELLGRLQENLLVRGIQI